jgi:4a-hydroxytetrahydrobiopterin dehydratase
VSAPDNQLLNDEALLEALNGLDGWSCADNRLSKRFEFEDFPAAMAFMTRAPFAAEALNHHPNWSNVYNRVEVELWSHDLGGVSSFCVELAQRMNGCA